MDDATLSWLLDGDPAVRWQAERDLLGAEESVWAATRERIPGTGWGSRLVALQDRDGTWGGGLYQPKWTSTTYTLLLLRRMGLHPAHVAPLAGCHKLLEDADWIEGGVSYWSGRLLAERCVNGMVLSICSYFETGDDRVDSIANLLIDAQMEDGGWNCRDHQGATHSSFHTTISVLEGLLEWKTAAASTAADTAIARGHEFLLEHRLYRSHRTGEVINEAWTTFHFPPRWHYDVLRGLDHLAAAGAAPDPRAGDAIDLVRAGRRADGRWGKGSQYSGETFFTLEPGRVAGRWNTLRALRVLGWWGAGAAAIDES
jgi:hypothetical protein